MFVKYANSKILLRCTRLNKPRLPCVNVIIGLLTSVEPSIFAKTSLHPVSMCTTGSTLLSSRADGVGP